MFLELYCLLITYHRRLVVSQLYHILFESQDSVPHGFSWRLGLLIVILSIQSVQIRTISVQIRTIMDLPPCAYTCMTATLDTASQQQHSSSPVMHHITRREPLTPFINRSAGKCLQLGCGVVSGFDKDCLRSKAMRWGGAGEGEGSRVSCAIL